MVAPYVDEHGAGARRTRASSATGTSSSVRCWTGPGGWDSTRWPRAIMPGSKPAPSGSPAGAGGGHGQGPVLCPVDAHRRRAGRRRAARRAPDQGRGARATRGGSGCPPRRSPTARTSASSSPTRAGAAFLADRVALHPGELVDADSGEVVGEVPAVELVTVGQRRGLGVAVDGRRRFALSVDVDAGRVLVGDRAAPPRDGWRVERPTWVDRPSRPGRRCLAQTSAHGAPARGRWDGIGVAFDQPQRLVAPGQTVALYDAADPDVVVGAGVAAGHSGPVRSRGMADPAERSRRRRRASRSSRALIGTTTSATTCSTRRRSPTPTTTRSCASSGRSKPRIPSWSRPRFAHPAGGRGPVGPLRAGAPPRPR